MWWKDDGQQLQAYIVLDQKPQKQWTQLLFNSSIKSVNMLCDLDEALCPPSDQVTEGRRWKTMIWVTSGLKVGEGDFTGDGA